MRLETVEPNRLRLMAHKNKYNGSEAQRQARAKTRAAVAKLNKLGVTSIDVSKPRKLGGSAYAALRKADALLAGNAVSRKAPKSVVKAHVGQLPVMRDRLIVPTDRTTERVTVLKSGAIKKTQNIAGNKITSYILPKHMPDSKIPHGKNITYAIALKNWTSKVRFKSFKELKEFLKAYDLENYMNAVEVVVGEEGEEGEE
jgi:hypothetical protein